MASIKDIKLKDLYFIEDNKHRRAFLKALREVEEEGFEIEEMETATIKIKQIQETSFEKQKVAANAAKNTELKGATPAELSMAMIMKRKAAKKYAETNAVDMKNYKYWRDDELKRIEGKNDNSKKDNGSGYSTFDMPREKGKSRKPGMTLYDELFGSGSDSEDFVKPFPKTRTYETLDSMFEGKKDDKTEEPQKRRLPKRIDVSSVRHQRRIHAIDEKVGEKTVFSDEHSQKPTDVVDDLQNDVVEAVDNVVETKDEVQEVNSQPEKLVVEVVAPNSVPAPVLVQEKPKKPRKPRAKSKKKKKMDSDLMRYHKIIID